MNLSYFQKINNSYKAKSNQEVDLYLINRNEDRHLDDTIDYQLVEKNGEPFEMLIIKDTDGNTFKKKIKSKNNLPFNLGDYIKWNNQIWLVTLLDTDDKVHHSGYMYLCTVPLRWQAKNGEIIERWAYSEDFTKYSSGVKSNSNITIGDNQYGLTLPIDSQTKLLKRDMRFCMDFDDSEEPEIYKLTNRKVELNNNEYFGRGGTMVLTMSFDSFNPEYDKKIRYGDKDVWICDYIPLGSPAIEPDITKDKDEQENIIAPTTPTYTVAFTGSLTLRIGRKKTWSVVVLDQNKNNIEFEWNVVSDIEVEKIISENSISLKVSDKNADNKKIRLEIIVQGNIIDELEITVKETW